VSNPKTMILGGAMKVAPLGADPTDEDAWTEIGYTTADMLHVDPAPDEPVHNTSMLDTIREWQQKIELSDAKVSYGLASYLGGIPVIESDHVPRSLSALVMDSGMGYQIIAPRAEFRPFTDLEREGEWAKRTVRHGLADVLAWLGEDVGPEPDAAYTDPGLYKVNLLGAIRGGIL